MPGERPRRGQHLLRRAQTLLGSRAVPRRLPRRQAPATRSQRPDQRSRCADESPACFGGWQRITPARALCSSPRPRVSSADTQSRRRLAGLGADRHSQRPGQAPTLRLRRPARGDPDPDRGTQALRRDHLDLDGRPDPDPPLPARMAVWPSVREHDDTKTRLSPRRPTLREDTAGVLREHRRRQHQARNGQGLGKRQSRVLDGNRHQDRRGERRREFNIITKGRRLGGRLERHRLPEPQRWRGGGRR